MLERRLRVSFDASNIVVAHTYIAYTAFISALVFACLLHYKKVVKNDVAGYPEEWFPSVSATYVFPMVMYNPALTLDWYPERNIFQILIALASGAFISLHLPVFPTELFQRPAIRAGLLAILYNPLKDFNSTDYHLHIWPFENAIVWRLGVHHFKRRSRRP